MKKLNLKSLELVLPKIDPVESKILLGGGGYNDTYSNTDHTYNVCDWTYDGPHICEYHACAGGGQDGQDSQDSQDSQDNQDHQDNMDFQDPMDFQDNMDFQDDRDFQDNQDYSDYQDQQNADTQDNQDVQQQEPTIEIENLPEIPSQLPSSCVFATIEFISTFFGDTISESESLLYYLQTYNADPQDIVTNGVPLDGNYLSFIDHFFDITYLEMPTGQDVQDALDAGHPIMAMLSTPLENGGADIAHQVTIVGYDENTGIFTYADTVTGEYLTAPASDFYTDTFIVIHGLP